MTVATALVSTATPPLRLGVAFTGTTLQLGLLAAPGEVLDRLLQPGLADLLAGLIPELRRQIGVSS